MQSSISDVLHHICNLHRLITNLLYHVGEITCDRPLSGARSRQTPCAARRRQRYLMSIALDTHRFHIFTPESADGWGLGVESSFGLLLLTGKVTFIPLHAHKRSSKPARACTHTHTHGSKAFSSVVKYALVGHRVFMRNTKVSLVSIYT